MPGKPCDISITALTHDGRGVAARTGRRSLSPGWSRATGSRADRRAGTRRTPRASRRSCWSARRTVRRRSARPTGHAADVPCSTCPIRRSWPGNASWYGRARPDRRDGRRGSADAPDDRDAGTVRLSAQGIDAGPAERDRIFARDSHRAVPFAECRIQHPAGPALRTALQGWM
jgi:hypothetical protein